MKICGIVSEYNPFHNGHKFHLEETKRLYGATHTIAIMSGNFTQRGDLALFDKYSRAEIALNNGIDLVIEIPVAYCLSSAENYARGAVGLLEALNCVDILSFGSECGDISRLKETAGAVEYVTQSDEFFTAMRGGKSYPAALSSTILKYYTDDVAEILESPNNTLGIEYIKALDNIGSRIEPVTVKRFGAGHDEFKESFNDSFASASQIRKLIVSGADFSSLVPFTQSYETADISRLETAILAKIRTMPTEEIGEIADVSLGLDAKIKKASRLARNLNELCFLVKSKRFTLARIRRILLCCFLGIRKKDLHAPVSYVRILAMNSKGKEILAKSDCKLPVGTSLKDLMKKSTDAYKQGGLEERCGNIYALAFENPRPCGMDFTRKPIIIE